MWKILLENAEKSRYNGRKGPIQAGKNGGNLDGCYGNHGRCHAEWGDWGLVILCGDVFDEKMRETVDNWCYQPVWTPSYSEFSKTSSENSFRRAAEYVKLWAGENVYFSLVVQDVTEAYIYAAGR